MTTHPRPPWASRLPAWAQIVAIVKKQKEVKS